MTSIIILISVILFFAEWFIIRKTHINKYALIITLLVIGIPLGTIVGLHLFAYPLVFTLLPLALCEIEDRYFKKKNMTDTEKSKLKDL